MSIDRRAKDIIEWVEEARKSGPVDLNKLYHKISDALICVEQEGYDAGLEAAEDAIPDPQEIEGLLDPEDVLEMMVDAGLCRMPANVDSRKAANVIEIFRDLAYKKNILTV